MPGKLKKQDQEFIDELLSLPLAELEERVKAESGYFTPIEDILMISQRTFALLQRDSIHLVNPGSDGLESVAQVIYGVRLRNTPLTGIFLTHRSAEYVDNLKYYFYLAQKDPKQFGFQLLCHEKNLSLANKRPCYALVQEEEFLKLDGRKYLLIKTPGHNKRSDHIAILEFEHKVLFVGIMLQPQGESYEFCTFLTPISNHLYPEDAGRSIEMLKSLPFDHAITAEGEYLDRDRAYRWMEITQKTFERTAHYCRKVFWDNDSKELEENSRIVFQSLALERNMSPDQIQKRFENQGGRSDFENYDFPSIAYYLRKFGME